MHTACLDRQLYNDCEKLAGEVDGKKKRMDEIKDQVVQANEQLREVCPGSKSRPLAWPVEADTSFYAPRRTDGRQARERAQRGDQDVDGRRRFQRQG